MVVVWASLIVGLTIGYVAQRSRLCLVGGIRDFLLIRDTYLLKGLGGLLLAAWIAFPLVSLLGGTIWDLPAEVSPAGPDYTEQWVNQIPEADPGEQPASPLDPPLQFTEESDAGGGLGGGYLSITLVLAILGGLGFGFFSTLANGCPLRQHVLAAQGSINAITYLLGFYLGAIIYHTWILPLIARYL